MDQQTFEDTLRRFKRQEPFQPFVIELTDGRTLFVDEPRLAFNGGNAVFFVAIDDAVFFSNEEVSQIRAATPQEVAS